MQHFVGALGIAAVSALVAAIVALLVAVLLVGGDRAVLGALLAASLVGLLALPVAWWRLGVRGRAVSGPPGRAAER